VEILIDAWCAKSEEVADTPSEHSIAISADCLECGIKGCCLLAAGERGENTNIAEYASTFLN